MKPFLAILASALAGCAGTSSDPEGSGLSLPDLRESEPALDDRERNLVLASALEEAENLLERRETEGALEHAIALLRHHWNPPPGPFAINALLAEAHYRVAERCDLKKERDRPRHERHRKAGLFHARRAIDLDPESGIARYWNGQLLLEAADAEQSMGRLKKAQEELRTAVRCSPEIDHGGPARMLGRTYQETPALFGGSRREAIRWFLRSLEFDPHFIRTRLWLAETYRANQEPERARSELEAILAEKPRPGHEKEDGQLQRQAAELLKKISPK